MNFAMRKKILFVDDEDDWRFMVTACLNEGGYEVLAARDASEAMLQAEGVTLDGIILDVNLAGENGLMLMRFLKRNHPDVPIILYTGLNHDEQAIQTMLKEGAQQLSPEQPALKWDHHASDDAIQQVKEQLAKHHLRAVNYGVVGAKDEADWRQVFEFARKLGLYGITTEAVQDLDLLEKLVKEFDIRVGIHEHARRPDDPSYKVWDPKYVLSVVKN